MSLKFLSENIWIILLIRMAHVLSLQDLFEVLASGEICAGFFKKHVKVFVIILVKKKYCRINK